MKIGPFEIRRAEESVELTEEDEIMLMVELMNKHLLDHDQISYNVNFFGFRAVASYSRFVTEPTILIPTKAPQQFHRYARERFGGLGGPGAKATSRPNLVVPDCVECGGPSPTRLRCSRCQEIMVK